MNIEKGQYISNGENDLYVYDVKMFNGDWYAFLVDEESECGYFCKLIRKDDGWIFERVKSDNLAKELIVEFSEIKEIVKNGGIDEF